MGWYRADGRIAGHVAALFLSTIGVAAACSCAEPKPEACQAAWQHSAVLAGTVNRIEVKTAPAGWTTLEVRLAVDRPLLGMEGVGKELTIHTGRGGGDCGYPFEVGHS